MDRKAKLNDLKSKEHELCDLLNESSYSITHGKVYDGLYIGVSILFQFYFMF
jgi:hypothetical protein